MESIFSITLLLGSGILMIWAILDLHKQGFRSNWLQTVCFLIILAFPLLGAILYFQFKRKLVSRKSFLSNS